ncbi:MAG TPA: DUF2784 domain-containing protein [Micromonosporaceae bacterium]|nr:DUF2784 domain-containing protein [Micromonosporaceae bacterium]
MGYRLLADTVMVLHFGFLGYVVLGGFLAWRWPWGLPPHLLAAAWGGLTVLFPATLSCPLTALEDAARRAAGQQGLPASGFIDHYLEDVVYPERYTGLIQVTAAIVVLVSWLGAYPRIRARATAGPVVEKPVQDRQVSATARRASRHNAKS